MEKTPPYKGFSRPIGKNYPLALPPAAHRIRPARNHAASDRKQIQQPIDIYMFYVRA
jgi:hypothetical protein